jgi:hypothetical protein
MITLSIILTLWGIISIYRLYKIAKKKQEPFHPYEGTVMDALGFFVGISIVICWVFYLCIFYLP